MAVHEGSVAARSVERALSARQAAYREEVARLIAAGVRVMKRNASFDPRVGEVVREAGLSNQTFYRHFRSKDEFLLAVLDDGVRELVAYLDHRMQGAPDVRAAVRCWLEGVVAQALDPEAAEATRPFVIPQARLAERFPEDIARCAAQITAPLRGALVSARDAGALPDCDPERDARAIYDLAMGWLQQQLVAAERPEAADADHIVGFALSALGC
jgi:AcrR family transcriptional regulator